MVETMGSGGGVLDYDGDGRDDIFLVQGGSPGGENFAAGRGNALFHNEGSGRFREVTREAGIAGTQLRDGLLRRGRPTTTETRRLRDGVRKKSLLQEQRDGTFTDATTPPAWGTRDGEQLRFADVDGTARWTLYAETTSTTPLAKGQAVRQLLHGRLSTATGRLRRRQRRLLSQQHGRTFTDANARGRLSPSEGRTGRGLLRLRRDGDQDLYVANDSVANFPS